ncbi:hypothetical protein ACKWTF_014367 [Chironomus riparius]
MKLLIILLLFVIKSCLVESTDSHESSHESIHFKITRTNYSDYKSLTKDCAIRPIRKMGYFTRALPTALIIHGYEADYKSEMAKELVKAFVSRKDHNVIFADWSAYAFDDYSEITHEIDHIANVFVYLLNKMMDDGYDLTQVYIIGHSLGAHIAGRVGNLLQHQNITLPRITGLDPAGPLFDYPAIKKKMFKISSSDHTPLSKDDAKFVDIIHTNAGLYRGSFISHGHQDFWPNCGVFQPHCDECKISKIFKDYKDCSMCSHIASWRYYAESVRSTVPIFEAERCHTKILMRFFCNGDKTSMGFHANENAKNGDYYIETNDSPPYSK